MGKRSHARYKPSPIPSKLDLSNSEISEEFDPETFSEENRIDSIIEDDELTRGTSDRDWDLTSQKLTAPVNLPARESLRVNLVPYDLVVKLDENRSDYDTYSGLTFLLLGAILGFILDLFVNRVKIDKQISTILISLSLLFLVFLYFFLKSLKRVNEKKLEIKNHMGTSDK